MAYEGPALKCLGSIGSMSGTFFSSNSFYCQEDDYGYDIDLDEVRPSKPRSIQATLSVNEDIVIKGFTELISTYLQPFVRFIGAVPISLCSHHLDVRVRLSSFGVCALMFLPQYHTCS